MTQKINETWARIKAIELLRSLAITQPEEIDLSVIAMHANVYAFEAPMRTAEAWLVRKPGR